MPAYKEKDGSVWYCQFWYTDWTGKRRHSSKRGFARKKDAEDYERSFKSRVQSEVISMPTLIAAYKEHLDNLCALGSLKISTADNYKINIDRYITGYFADVKNITTITPDHVNKWLATITMSQFSPDKKLHASTLRNIRSRLRQIMEYAQNNYGLQNNPVDRGERIKRDGRKNKRAKMWTLAQYQIFRDSLPRYSIKVFFDTLFFAGLRIGEACAITPADIVPYKIIISRNYIPKNKLHNAHISTPKTYSSRREVQIPHFLYRELQDYISQIYGLADDDLLFNFNPQGARDIMTSKIQALGLPYASPHTLRHSYASLLLNVTKDITVVAKQIGHSNPKTTWAVYSHMVPGQDREAVDKLESQIGPLHLASTK